MQEKTQKNITEPVTELGISMLGASPPSPPFKGGGLRPHTPSDLTYPNVTLLT